MIISLKKAIYLLACTLLISGCQQRPEFVYVPDDSFQEIVTISASHEKVQVEQPLILRASRRTKGQYIKVRYSSLPPGSMWWAQQAPAFEEEVADNLRWDASPQGTARFNVEYRHDHTRTVVFLEPGTYTLAGYSKLWDTTETKSNAIVIEVEK